MMKRMRYALFFLAAVLFAQVPTGFIDLPDITGTGVAVALSASHIYAVDIQITCASTNSSIVRIGGSTVSSSRGTRCPAGAGQFLPPNGKPRDLALTYVWIANSDVVSVSYDPYVQE